MLVIVSRVHPALFAFAIATYAYGCAFAPWNCSFHASKKNDNAAKFLKILGSFRQNSSEGFIDELQYLEKFAM